MSLITCPVRVIVSLALLLALTALASPTAPSAAAAPGRADASLARGWQHVLISAPNVPAQGPFRVVAGGPGLVAAGEPTYHLWVSANGRAWRSVRTPAFRHGETPLSFYAVGRLYIITGSAGGQSRIWASKDASATWHESPAHLRITALAAGGDGAVAFSQADVFQPIGVWTSADGLTWRRLPQKPGVFASAQVLSVAKGAHGLVAGGTVLKPPRQWAGIWTSTNGRSWERVSNNGGAFGNGSDGSQVYQMAVGQQGIVAIGVRLPLMPRSMATDLSTWASRDGVHWQRRSLGFYDPNEGFDARIAAWRGGFVMLDNEGGETAVWSSANGLIWTRLGSDDLFGGTARVLSAAPFQGGGRGRKLCAPSPARLPDVAELRRLRSPHVPAGGVALEPCCQRIGPCAHHRRSDPRMLKLLPFDGTGDKDRTAFAGAYSAYVNLCAADPALGPHRAYTMSFGPLEGGNFADTATSIVTASASVSGAALRDAPQLLLAFDTILHQRELTASVHVGEETRVFQLRIDTESEGSEYTYTKFAVAWRKDRVIGIVITGTQQEAVLLAQKQLNHLNHPAG